MASSSTSGEDALVFTGGISGYAQIFVFCGDSSPRLPSGWLQSFRASREMRMRFSVLSNPPKEGRAYTNLPTATVELRLRSMNTASPRLRRAYFECRHGQLHVHNAIPVGGGFDELTTLICLHGSAAPDGCSWSSRSFSAPAARSTARICPAAGIRCGGESLVGAAYADAIGDFLDSMRFRQVDLLGAGAGAAVAAELAIGRPKVVRKVCLLGPGRQRRRRRTRRVRASCATRPLR